MKQENMGLIPIRNFGVLDDNIGIYRSAQPEYGYEYSWLTNMLGIKKIVNLRAESNHDNNNAIEHGIEVINYDIKDHNCPTLEQANQFIELIKNNKEPLLFHCEHGHGRTSTFSVLAKLAMGWAFEDAMNDEKTKFHYQFKHLSQENFLIDNFKNYNNGKNTTI